MRVNADGRGGGQVTGSGKHSGIEELLESDEFARRHIGPDAEDGLRMLRAVGYSTMEQLLDRVVPSDIRLAKPLSMDSGRSEVEVLAELRALAARNDVVKSFIGMGYHDTHTPSVILRNVLENPAWYTAYTPYQPEISQGRLEALLNFQTMVADLTGLELANASMLDEATAAAEAMAMCRRVGRSKSDTFFVSEQCHPRTIDVVRTRAEPIGIRVVVGDHAKDLENVECFGVLLQYPGTRGDVHDYRPVTSAAHAKNALVVMAADLLALTLLAPPGEVGADIAVGSAQRFGVPLFFGGPHAAYLATREEYKRALPGRLVGLSVDSLGQPAYRLALQTREQHIRREKATSNICTAQALLAVVAAMYAAYHGPEGLRTIARRTHRLTAALAEGLRQRGWPVPTEAFFDTITVATGERTREMVADAAARGMNLRRVDEATVGIALDETTTPAELERLLAIFSGGRSGPEIAALDAVAPDAIPATLRRRSVYLTQPVFNRYHTETEMLRYLRRLADKDLALDRAMIPLGSCTMKLNATTEMMPISWEAFSGIHPFAPVEQTRGYQALIADLERMLCDITGYAAFSLQPNAGSQGEYAGLLVIRAYHRSRGEGHRDVCLIPSSAHGTNPASAQMAGMRVVVVRCDRDGNVDLQDLREKVRANASDLAALMVTYPSTHGVFEPGIREICDVVHEHGGQVYIDGANMNAMVGLCRPGRFGGDVSHLNLHKTFCIPHGGGGPGAGPIGVAAHLVPFLPRSRFDGGPDSASEQGMAISAAPWGSAGILPISWAYIRLMGRDGLTRASAAAILNANYIAKRLSPHYPVLYTGTEDLVAHECIVDLRPLKEATGITVDDVAKRLIDYGFHAPTMSFPVTGTLMIEPTESESLAELDRFCEAMIAIRREIRSVENGELSADESPLRNAPHTTVHLIGDWNHPYSREQAVFPVSSLREAKYWSPVARVDNVHGDRHLVCTCPPVSDYETRSGAAAGTG